MHASLSRTSSVASISSDDAVRRTRKRFTSVQLMMLEQVFHQTSHPTREEREAVAQAAGMEIKSVTIWFQNKRQTERKVALHHATNQPTDAHRSALFPSSSPRLSPPYASAPTSASTASHSVRGTHVRTLSASFCTTSTHSLRDAHTPRRKLTPPRPRPSLDRIATRSESRLPPPRTPTKPRDPHAALWDNMPSSPLAPPASPPARDLVEFMGSSRTTLEWACAAARLAGKQGRRKPHVRQTHTRSSSRHDRDRERESELGRKRDQGRDGHADADTDGDAGMMLPGEDTEEDDIEAVTPEGSLGASDAVRWNGGAHAAVRSRPGLPLSGFAPTSADTMPLGTAPLAGLSASKEWLSLEVGPPERGDGKDVDDVPQDEDMMRAALALCGLGRTR